MTLQNSPTPDQPTKSHWLDLVPWRLAPLAVVLALLPFNPPHLYEKITFLIQGNLSKPLDIFDLFFHGSPLFIILLKTIRHLAGSRS
jgi:hypothetical protein